VDVKSKRCEHDGCKTRASYNIEGQKPRYCVVHKLEGMVDVKNKRCEHDGCKNRASYNIEGQQPIYCAEHKIEGMVEVKSKRCEHDGCKKYRIYNIEGQQPIYCAEHKLEGMVNVTSKRCDHDGCKKHRVYNIEGQTPIYCFNHKLEGMVNVTSKRCKNYGCFTSVTKKYDGYCFHCYVNMYPNIPLSRNYKTKEYAVRYFVKSEFPDYNFVANKMIDGGSSRKQPDLLLDLGHQTIIIEVDENKHTYYNYELENKRMMEISEDVGHKPIIFIRFNPDDYQKNGMKITSCWYLDEYGVCVVKKSKNNEWTERLNTLKAEVEYWSNPENTTNKKIEIVQLFYDV
jgi:Holliday junction resolvase